VLRPASPCFCRKAGFFCALSSSVVESLDQVSHHSTMPAGAILFVEGQISRGIFILCSGKVKFENHCHMVAIYHAYYNFCRVHQTLRVTPAMESGLTNHVWSLQELVGLLENNRQEAVA
jgi:hypothetical protein